MGDPLRRTAGGTQAGVGIAVACLLRTIIIGARTVRIDLNRRADKPRSAAYSWRLPCAGFPPLRPCRRCGGRDVLIAAPSKTVKGAPTMMAKMPKCPPKRRSRHDDGDSNAAPAAVPSGLMENLCRRQPIRLLQRDGARLRYACWARRNASGTVVVMPGRGES